MPKPISPNPTPVAVPWTPDITAHPVAAAGSLPVPSPAPVMANPVPPAAHNPYSAVPQYPAPNPIAGQPIAPQAIQHYAPQQQVQQQFRAQQPLQATPMPQQAHYGQPHVAPQMQAQAYTPQGQISPSQHVPTLAPQYAPQAPIPPLVAPPLETALHSDVKPSKSLIAKLLKRSQKPNLSEVVNKVEAPLKQVSGKKDSGSLFNKNFLLGAVTGLVVGTFVVPLLLNLFGTAEPALTQTRASGSEAVGQVIPAATTAGSTFIDQAIASDQK